MLVLIESSCDVCAASTNQLMRDMTREEVTHERKAWIQFGSERGSRAQ